MVRCGTNSGYIYAISWSLVGLLQRPGALTRDRSTDPGRGRCALLCMGDRGGHVLAGLVR
jgi:hypothetical protein